MIPYHILQYMHIFIGHLYQELFSCNLDLCHYLQNVGSVSVLSQSIQQLFLLKALTSHFIILELTYVFTDGTILDMNNHHIHGTMLPLLMFHWEFPFDRRLNLLLTFVIL